MARHFFLQILQIRLAQSFQHFTGGNVDLPRLRVAPRRGSRAGFDNLQHYLFPYWVGLEGSAAVSGIEGINSIHR